MSRNRTRSCSNAKHEKQERTIWKDGSVVAACLRPVGSGWPASVLQCHDNRLLQDVQYGGPRGLILFIALVFLSFSVLCLLWPFPLCSFFLCLFFFFFVWSFCVAFWVVFAWFPFSFWSFVQFSYPLGGVSLLGASFLLSGCS